MDYNAFMVHYGDFLVADYYIPETQINVCVVSTESGLLLECVFHEDKWLYFDVYNGECEK